MNEMLNASKLQPMFKRYSGSVDIPKVWPVLDLWIGPALRLVREKLEMNQSDVVLAMARECDCEVTQGWLSRMEFAEIPLDLRRLGCLCVVYNVAPETIMAIATRLASNSKLSDREALKKTIRELLKARRSARRAASSL